MTRFITTAAVLLFAASARASSPIPANNVDDFGPPDDRASVAAPAEVATAHASPIPSNNIDDFGSLTPSDAHAVPGATAAAHGSPIPSNNIDEFGLDAGALPIDAATTEGPIHTAMNPEP